MLYDYHSNVTHYCRTCKYKELDERCREDKSFCQKTWLEPSTIVHRWVSMRSNITTISPFNPAALYTMSGLHDGYSNYEFNISVLEVAALHGAPPLQKAEHLRMTEGFSEPNSASLYLINPLIGPQTVKLSLEVTSRRYSRLGVLHRTVLYLLVSEFDGTGF